MSSRIACYTLFNITQTGVSNRNKPSNSDVHDWIQRRNTQCNFDTILQVISLRSQPDVTKIPTSFDIRFDEFNKFGLSYQQEENVTYKCWQFEFEVHHASVFENGITSFGALYNDCDKVPMIMCENQYQKTPSFLDSSIELCNIVFEVI